ncbi:MAG: MBL fold metallo-hydrolase, partial [Gammaproteobacteria bacterium]
SGPRSTRQSNMSTSIPFNKSFECEYGAVQTVAPMIRRVVARNPSPFTFHGTGTYIIGHGKVAVVDPGPDLGEHVEALLDALGGEEVTHLLVTHTHLDHSPACRHLRAATGAPAYGYGPHGSGKLEEGVKVEEGGDFDFVPDREVRDGDVIEGDGWSVECVYTPGHTSNHICYGLREQRALFSGDHVMGWSTTVVSPPDGDMRQYISSLEKLLGRDDATYWPTHGGPIRDPKPFAQAYLEHRHERVRQILACLDRDLTQIDRMVPAIYTGLPPALVAAAGRQVLAALVYLVETGEAAVEGELAMGASFRRAR